MEGAVGNCEVSQLERHFGDQHGNTLTHRKKEMSDCPHTLQSKLIEIPGKDGKMWGTLEYEPDYDKLGKIARKVATGEGVNYCYLEFVYCNGCSKILEIIQVFTD